MIDGNKKNNIEDQVLNDFNEEFISKLQSFNHHIAIHDNGRYYTYHQLILLVKEISEFLISIEASPKTLITIELGRSAELVIIILACVIKKIPFLLINIEWPSFKKDKLISLSNPKFIIDNKSNTRIIFEKNGLKFSIHQRSIPENLSLYKQIYFNDYIAYLATSSGSSGEIKCALVGVKGLLNLMKYQSKFFQINPRDKILQISSPGFDAIISEIFVSLWGGAQLDIVSVPNNELIVSIEKIIDSGEIDLVTMTPSVAKKIPSSVLVKLKTLILAGESPSRELISKLLGKVKLINAFGLCETTVCSHMHEIQKIEEYECIGYPLPYIKAKIVDGSGKEVSRGESGELYIYGDAVGYGYLNHEEDDNFGVDPQGVRFFKTGDIVKVTECEKLYYMGRLDSQIKLRGQKVNLNEISQLISQLQDINNAYIYLMEETKLILFYEGNATISKVTDYLKLYLPSVSIPKDIIKLDFIPLNSNGKIDSFQLREMLKDHKTDNINLIVENNSNRNKGIKILEEVLEHNSFKLEDDFFYVGGDSLKVVDLITKFNEITGQEMDLAEFLNKPTINNFLSMIENRKYLRDPYVLFNEQLSTINTWPIRSPKKKEFSKVLLTGATGQVGQAILCNLLNITNLTVICLGRGSGLRINKTVLRRCSDEEYLKRIEWIQCDLNNSSAIQNAIEMLANDNELGCIIHCGAYVNHIYGFAELYQSNVESTFKLLQFAHENSINKFIYISSTSAQFDNNSEATGYDLSKGASEIFVKVARTKGLEACVLKLPLVYETNFPKFSLLKKDHFICKTLQCLQIKAIPEAYGKIVSISADDCGKVIANMCIHNEVLEEEFVLINDNGICWKLFTDSLAKFSLPIVSYAEWRKRLFQLGSERAELASFLSLYKDGGPLSNTALPKMNNLEKGIIEFKKFLRLIGFSLMSSEDVLNEIFEIFKKYIVINNYREEQNGI